MSIAAYIAVLSLAILLYSDIGLLLAYARVDKTCNKRCHGAPVSIIIAAYNCKDTIEETLLSILSSNLKTFEIIVVDDGSTDSTREIALSFAGRIVRVVSQDHQNKWAALNKGVEYCSYDAIAIVDSDTIVTPETIGILTDALLRHDAVTANLQVEREMNLLVWLQAQEHLRIAMHRRAGGVDTLSGACAAFRKTLLKKHPFSPSIVEDYEHTARIRKVGASVGYVPCAVAYTHMPSHANAYVSQRLRWTRGTLHEMAKSGISRITLLKGYLLASADIVFVIASLISGMWWALALAFIVEAVLQSYGAYHELRSMKYTSLLFFPVLVMLAILSLAIGLFGMGSVKKVREGA